MPESHDAGIAPAEVRPEEEAMSRADHYHSRGRTDGHVARIEAPALASAQAMRCRPPGRTGASTGGVEGAHVCDFRDVRGGGCCGVGVGEEGERAPRMRRATAWGVCHARVGWNGEPAECTARHSTKETTIRESLPGRSVRSVYRIRKARAPRHERAWLAEVRPSRIGGT